jgi:hypothetical protein
VIGYLIYPIEYKFTNLEILKVELSCIKIHYNFGIPA